MHEILDRRGLALNQPIGERLPNLGLGRAYGLQGEISKTKVAYLDFLTLGKNVDPDIPITATR